MRKLSDALAEASQFLDAFEGNPEGRIVNVQQPSVVFIECEPADVENFTHVSLMFVGNELLITIR